MAVLKIGSKGNAVKDLQKKLNKAKAKPPLEEDGVFGKGTAAAVKAFQKKAGLKVDGIAGPNTMAALDGKTPPGDKDAKGGKDDKTAKGGAGTGAGDGSGKKTKAAPAKWTHPDYIKLSRTEAAAFGEIDRELKDAMRKIGDAGLSASDRKALETLHRDWGRDYPTWTKYLRTLLRDHKSFQKVEKSDPAKAGELVASAAKHVAKERALHGDLGEMKKAWARLQKPLAKVL